MASSRKKRRGLSIAVIVVLCLLLIAVVAAAVGYSLVARRVKALQAGASFTLDYEITPTADSPALYGILQQAGATNGTVTGQYEPNALQLSIAAKKAVIPADPLTRVYVSSDETLYDVGQLYRNVCTSITDAYPLAGLLIPDWSLGSYISQSQLASLLGVGTEATSLQDVTEFQLDAKGLQRPPGGPEKDPPRKAGDRNGVHAGKSPRDQRSLHRAGPAPEADAPCSGRRRHAVFRAVRRL